MRLAFGYDNALPCVSSLSDSLMVSVDVRQVPTVVLAEVVPVESFVVACACGGGVGLALADLAATLSPVLTFASAP